MSTKIIPMRAHAEERLAIKCEPDVATLRHRVRDLAAKVGMGLTSQTHLLTAASELARNMLKYADGGTAQVEIVTRDGQRGIRLTFDDRGPGIPDVDMAMKNGFSTGGGLGMGLPGSRRLVNEFEITSVPGEGTRVILIKWADG